MSPAGMLLVGMGDFGGVDRRGVPRGLLFPASMAFTRFVPLGAN